MRKYIPFHTEYDGVVYSFLSFCGVTISKRIFSITQINNKKIEREMDTVDNPYKANPITETFLQNRPKITHIIKLYAFLIIWLYHYFYPGLWILSHIRLNIYANAVEACDVFHKIHPKQQKVLCLPRSVFAATTSKRFSKNGIMIIGGFLPSHHMHAWIMEDERNAYRWDQIWINYTPLCAMI